MVEEDVGPPHPAEDQARGVASVVRGPPDLWLFEEKRSGLSPVLRLLRCASRERHPRALGVRARISNLGELTAPQMGGQNRGDPVPRPLPACDGGFDREEL